MRVAPLMICAMAALTLGCREPAPDPGPPAAAAPDPAYVAEIEQWRADRETRLRKPDGWLALAGLYWLEEGESRFGSAPDNDLVFPLPAPAYWGSFRRADREVWVEFEAGKPAFSEGQPFVEGVLAADTSGEPTLLESGSLSFYLIERGPRLGIRLKDSSSALLEAFEGMESFPIDPLWRLEGRFVPYREPKTVQVPNIIGDSFEEAVPGRVVFEVRGREYGLEPTGDPEDSLFLVFGDETNGTETYGGGRFLYTEAPDENGRVIVDFNKAYNPPCVFTPYATCPLPRRENKLALRIEAGEKSFRGGVH